MAIIHHTGFVGKMPAYGDFVEGGAAHGARRAAANWAQQALGVGGTASRPGFADTFLTTPIWRFALAAGAFGPTPSAGVFCPSMDSSGRLFPLIVVTELSEGTGVMATALRLLNWYAAMEEVALGALPRDATREVLLGALADPPEWQGGAVRDADSVPHDAPMTLHPLTVGQDGAPDPLAVEGDLLANAPASTPSGIWITTGTVNGHPYGYEQQGQIEIGLLDRLLGSAPPQS